MGTQRFDQIARFFADRRLSRRAAIRAGGAGFAAGLAAGVGRSSAQDATPTAVGSGEKVEHLFVQSFGSGTIAAKEGAEATFTLTLEHGFGQTIYFSDRPERIVGAGPTAQFLAGFPFEPTNPPNAALVVDAPGGAEVAVVELTNPRYEEATHTATYDATILADPAELGITVADGAGDGSGLPASFGAAHLFIDDCPDLNGWCWRCGNLGCTEIGWLAGPDLPDHGWPTCYQFPCCEPCAASESWDHLAALCNAQFSACEGQCTMKLPGSCLL